MNGNSCAAAVELKSHISSNYGRKKARQHSISIASTFYRWWGNSTSSAFQRCTTKMDMKSSRRHSSCLAWSRILIRQTCPRWWEYLQARPYKWDLSSQTSFHRQFTIDWYALVSRYGRSTKVSCMTDTPLCRVDQDICSSSRESPRRSLYLSSTIRGQATLTSTYAGLSDSTSTRPYSASSQPTRWPAMMWRMTWSPSHTDHKPSLGNLTKELKM